MEDGFGGGGCEVEGGVDWRNNINYEKSSVKPNRSNYKTRINMTISTTRLKFHLLLPIFLTLILSCGQMSTDLDFTPTLEVLNEDKVLWNAKPLYLIQLDSVLSDYRETIPERFRDSIKLKLIVPTPETSMATVQEVKIALRKNQIFRLTYVMKK